MLVDAWIAKYGRPNTSRLSLGTFSREFCLGLRVGWTPCPLGRELSQELDIQHRQPAIFFGVNFGVNMVSVSASELRVGNVDLRRWYVVRTQPHREFRAECQLSEQGFRCFLPTYWKTIRHARQFRTTKAAFFPGYLFIELSLSRDRWRSVNGTYGVSGMIMEGDRPRPVPPGVVEALAARCTSSGLMSPADDLAIGRSVRVLSGPFSGCIGELLTLESSGRVQILLEIMGGRVSVSARETGFAPAF